MNTNELALRAKKGDILAFEKLYAHFSVPLMRYIRSMLANQQDAEDVLQDSFIKMYRKVDTIKSESLNFSAWLYRIARNTVFDYLRKRYRQPNIVVIDNSFDCPESGSLFSQIMEQSDFETACKDLSQLPEKYREIINLRVFSGLTVSEVATKLHKKEISIRVMQHRARKALRALTQKGEDESRIRQSVK